MLSENELDLLYSLFRFKKIKSGQDNVVAYAYRSAYFSNADIIPLMDDADVGAVFNSLKELGYACNIRNYRTRLEAEEELFKGFFDLDSSKKNNENSYETYIRKITNLIGSSYQYLPSKFYDYVSSENVEDEDIVDNIVEELSKAGPCLVVLEAAAGYGKTSTSYEVFNKINSNFSVKIPLLAELSRNRQASIFKYVLYDEIDKKFTGINLDIVISFIKKGWIPLMIDGFDELLKSRKTEDDNLFEEAEPMLETIKELLEGEAKILLTTRRTALFSGDEFHVWIEKSFSDNNINVKRYVLYPPSIEDWLKKSRINDLERVGLRIDSISNPVLLSYLRSLDEAAFNNALKDTDSIITSYLTRLLEREKERHSLPVSPEEQTKILVDIAGYLADEDITYTDKDKIEDLILQNHEILLLEIKSRYPPSERPTTIEQIAAKFSLHAMLDRRGDNEERIGFVNDFIFGTYIGAHVLDTPEWFSTERFVDYCLLAYQARTIKTRLELWDNLRAVSTYLDCDSQVRLDTILKGKIARNVSNESLEDLIFYDSIIEDGFQISNSVFNNCIFHNINFNTSDFNQASFINCTFYNCILTYMNGSDFIFSGCKDNNGMLANWDSEIMNNYIEENEIMDEILVYKRHVLERFWPAGRERFATNRVITTLKMGISPNQFPKIDEAIDALIRDGFIIKERGKCSLRLNLYMGSEVKKILGR